MDTVTITPADAYGVVARLMGKDMRARSSKALDHVLKERRHGSVAELARALDVSAPTIRNWRNGDWPPSPDQVWAICRAYVAAPDGIGAVGAEAGHGDLGMVGELFNRFYSDNERDAAAWLIEHKPANFACNTGDQAPMVA